MHTAKPQRSRCVDCFEFDRGSRCNSSDFDLAVESNRMIYYVLVALICVLAGLLVMVTFDKVRPRWTSLTLRARVSVLMMLLIGVVGGVVYMCWSDILAEPIAYSIAFAMIIDVFGYFVLLNIRNG